MKKAMSRDNLVNIMMLASPIFPIIDANGVASYLNISVEEATSHLQDLWARKHFCRKKVRKTWKYCESTRQLGLSDRDLYRQDMQRRKFWKKKKK